MAQEYYTLEEAARFVNLPVEKQKEMAQKRQVRAFSDGGSWKFRKSDLEGIARPGSGDDADILADENVLLDESALSSGGSASLDDEATVVGMSAMRRADESDIQLVVSDAESRSHGQEDEDVVPIGDEAGRAPSDSDIRLTLDEGMPAKSTEDLELIKADAEQTDYDIGALDSSPAILAASDDLGTAAPSASDSVMTMALESITLDEDEDIGLSAGGSGSGSGSGSGIDSGLNLQHPSDSGISLEATDASADSDFELSLEGGDDDLFKSDEVPGFKDVDEDELPAVAKKPAAAAKPRTETDELSNSDFELAIDEDLETEEESGSEVVAIPEDEEEEEVGDEFEEEDEYGEELPAAVGLPRAAGMMVAANPAWPAWMVIPCALTSIVLAVVGMMMYEVMRHAWSLQTEHTLVGNVVKAVADLFAGSS
jgi:excisionase family DNA binding protein